MPSQGISQAGKLLECSCRLDKALEQSKGPEGSSLWPKRISRQAAATFQPACFPSDLITETRIEKLRAVKQGNL